MPDADLIPQHRQHQSQRLRKYYYWRRKRGINIYSSRHRDYRTVENGRRKQQFLTFLSLRHGSQDTRMRIAPAITYLSKEHSDTTCTL